MFARADEVRVIQRSATAVLLDGYVYFVILDKVVFLLLLHRLALVTFEGIDLREGTPEPSAATGGHAALGIMRARRGLVLLPDTNARRATSWGVHIELVLPLLVSRLDPLLLLVSLPDLPPITCRLIKAALVIVAALASDIPVLRDWIRIPPVPVAESGQPEAVPATEDLNVISASLTPEQKDVFLRCLAPARRLIHVDANPGTGKSHLIAALASAIKDRRARALRPSQKTLFIAPTNYVVDVFLSRSCWSRWSRGPTTTSSFNCRPKKFSFGSRSFPCCKFSCGSRAAAFDIASDTQAPGDNKRPRDTFNVPKTTQA
ncbi:hypothetical protein HDU86_004519 [Geranomyces michiganensis]|nr:hypothetical protein HDU86_004519 [Geranomyces michiganensis]